MAESKVAPASAINHPIERRASRASRTSDAVDEADEGILAEFGYKQELKRDWGLIHNFGISFSIIVSIPAPQWRLPHIHDLSGCGRANIMISVSHHWYHYPLPNRPSHGRPWGHVRRLDRGLILHDIHRHQHGRNRFRNPHSRRALLLGCDSSSR